MRRRPVITDFTCEYVNEIGAKLAGRSVEELIGRPVSEVSAGSLESVLFDRCREVLDSGRPWQEQISTPGSSPGNGPVWDVKVVRVELDSVAVSYREITEQIRQHSKLEHAAQEAGDAAQRAAQLQHTPLGPVRA
jgi:hypothetical protein